MIKSTVLGDGFDVKVRQRQLSRMTPRFLALQQEGW